MVSRFCESYNTANDFFFRKKGIHHMDIPWLMMGVKSGHSEKSPLHKNLNASLRDGSFLQHQVIVGARFLHVIFILPIYFFQFF